MEISLESYIKNPMGEKTAVMTNRDMYNTSYSQKLDKLLLREAGTIFFRLYRLDESYIAYIRIPSESIEGELNQKTKEFDKFFYEVVFKFTKPEDSNPTTLNNYNVQFYANDSAFVFTFAYAFNHNKLFIPELIPKVSKMAISTEAKVRNPKNEIGYVKTIYFAYLIMKTRNLFNTSLYNEKITKTQLQNMITHSDIKAEQRTQISKKPRHTTTDINKDNNEIKELLTKVTNSVKKITGVGNVNTTKNVKSIKTVSRTTKKIK